VCMGVCERECMYVYVLRGVEKKKLYGSVTGADGWVGGCVCVCVCVCVSERERERERERDCV